MCAKISAAPRQTEGMDTVFTKKKLRPPPANRLPLPTMPLLYTAATISAKKIQAPAFTKRGLDGLTSGRLGQIQHVGMAVEKQIAYDGYITNLPAFMHATAVQATVSCKTTWFPPKIDANHLIPFELPPLVVSAKKPFG